MRFCNNNMRTFATLVFVLVASVPVAFVQAQPTGGNTGSSVTLINPLSAGNCNATNSDCLGAFLQGILAFVIRIGSIVVVLMIVYVGFKFVTAQGNDAKITEARTMLLWTVIGALVLLGAQVIALGIQATVQSLGG